MKGVEPPPPPIQMIIRSGGRRGRRVWCNDTAFHLNRFAVAAVTAVFVFAFAANAQTVWPVRLDPETIGVWTPTDLTVQHGDTINWCWQSDAPPINVMCDQPPPFEQSVPPSFPFRRSVSYLCCPAGLSVLLMLIRSYDMMI